jgi:hypothetical protein
MVELSRCSNATVEATPRMRGILGDGWGSAANGVSEGPARALMNALRSTGHGQEAVRNGGREPLQEL